MLSNRPLKRRAAAGVFVIGLGLWFASQALLQGQTILQQNFNNSANVAIYVNAASPSSSQFNTIAGSGGTTVSATDIGFDTGRALVINRSGGAGSAVLARTTDLAAQPGTLRMQFKFTPGYFSVDASSVLAFQVGSNFTTSATVESPQNAAATITVDLRPSLFSLVGDWWGWSGSAVTFAGFQGNGFPLVTWVVNNRSAVVSYTNPNGQTTNIGPNRFDLWMGDSGLARHVFQGMAVANSAVPLTDFKMVVTGGQAQYAIDELVIQQLATFSVGPSIISQPTNLTVNAASPALFAVEAAGTPTLRYQWRKANAPIAGATNAAYTIDSTQTNQAGGYSVVISNTINSITSSVATLTVVPVITLGDAADANQFSWTGGGNAGWTGQTNTSHDHVDAAQSGTISDSLESWMETKVVGPGTLSFWWKVSSESGYDYLEFYTNNVLQSGRISGGVDWQQRSFGIAAGTNTVRWRYAKDGSASSGQDRGWVDEIKWQPAPPTRPSLSGVVIVASVGVQFTLLGQPNQVYWVQASSNLVNWVSILTNSSPTGIIPVSDLTVGNQRQRFYRALTP